MGRRWSAVLDGRLIQTIPILDFPYMDCDSNMNKLVLYPVGCDPIMTKGVGISGHAFLPVGECLPFFLPVHFCFCVRGWWVGGSVNGWVSGWFCGRFVCAEVWV